MESLNYQNYLGLAQLLSAQNPKTQPAEHDEFLFIIIHQVYELWFKQILIELEFLEKTLLQSQDTPRALSTLKRIRTIVKTLVAQVDVLETMTPLNFNSFRPMLAQSSGLQSAQFREIMFFLGEKKEAALKRYAPQSDAYQKLEARLCAPSIYDAVLFHIQACGHPLPDGFPRPPSKASAEPAPELHNLLIDLYRNDAIMRQLCEALVDLDEGFQEWRYRHVKMVERTIGTKMGTGGTDGAAFLRQSLFKPLFADLWDIRSQL